jgi:hypothetical protein
VVRCLERLSATLSHRSPEAILSVRDSSGLPNGAHFIGGPGFQLEIVELQPRVSRMEAFVPENITGRELQIAIHEQCLVLKEVG